VRWFDRAMFLEEYLDPEMTGSVGREADTVDLTGLLDRWRSTCARGSHVRFAHRLAALGLDPVSAVDALQPRRFNSAPKWASAAIQIGASAPALLAGLDRSDDLEVPFASLYQPWTRFGLDRLAQRSVDPAELSRSLGAMLLGRLRGCGEAVLLDEFERSGLGHDRWIEHQLEASLTPLFESLPVWARLVTTATLDWIDALVDFLTALDADAAIVSRLAGGGEAIPVWVHQAGDPHNGGRQVIVVTTTTDRRVVYKPRSLGPEAMTRAAADHLRSCGAIDVDLVGDVVDRGDHGWMEWIDTALPTGAQTARYSYNAGLALALAHRLAITDLHVENVLPAGDRPVLVDLECLGSGRPNLVTSTVMEAAREEILDRSVITTGMLISVGNQERDGRDDSGLTGILEPADGEVDASHEWVGLGTDEIGLVRTRVQRRSDDEPLMLDVDRVISGLDACEHAIDRYGLGVDVHTNVEVRVIAQNTARYVTLLQRIVQRAALSSGLRCSIELDAVSRPGTEVRASPWRLGACEIERRHLQRLDIPLFTVGLDATSGRLGSYMIPELVDVTGTSIIERRHRDAGPSFRRLQRDVTRLLLDQRLALAGGGGSEATSPVVSSPSDPFSVCEALAADLEARAIPDDHGGLTWLDVERPGRFARPVVADAGLMSGNAGIALFLAGLARVSRQQRWADLARATLGGSPPNDGPSLSYGSSGRGYALLVAGRLLDDDELVRRGHELLMEVPPAIALPRVDPLDFLAGLPGIAAALGAAATTVADPRLAERATDHLDVSHGAWHAAVIGRDVRARMAATRFGVAHGITGVELAVARVIEARRAAGLAAAPKHEQWLAELLSCENERIDRRDGTPGRLDPVTREPDVGWCWGVSGFVTARRAIGEITDLAAATHGIECGEALAAAGTASADRACCGTASRVAALTGAPRAAVVEQLLERRGRWTFEEGSPFQSVSLLRGSAGLGLALLDHVRPGAVPNALIVEPA